MNEEAAIHYLIKFGQREHLEMLQNDGLIYMNTIGWFRKYEVNKQIGDRYDSYDEIQQVKWMKLTFPDGKTMELSVNGEKNRLTSAQNYISEQRDDFNLYCMYAITDQIKDEYFIDMKNAEFGDSFLLIKNVPVFINRIETELRKSKLKYRHDLVSYYDKNSFTGELGFFKKSEEFAHQNEYRIVVQTLKNEPFKLNIGSIKGFADIFDIAKLKTIKVKIIEKQK